MRRYKAPFVILTSVDPLSSRLKDKNVTMSVGLKTKITAAIELDDLILDSRCALQEMLNVPIVPKLMAAQFVDKKWRTLDRPQQLRTASPIVGLSIKGAPEMAVVCVYERTSDRFPQPDWSPEELGEIASVEVCGIRTGLSFALVGAISLAIARRCGGLIADEIGFYTSLFDSSADDFLRLTRVQERMDDYRKAANRFEQQLPKG